MNEETDPVVQLLGRIEIRQIELNERIKQVRYLIMSVAFVFLFIWYITTSTLRKMEDKIDQIELKVSQR